VCSRRGRLPEHLAAQAEPRWARFKLASGTPSAIASVCTMCIASTVTDPTRCPCGACAGSIRIRVPAHWPSTFSGARAAPKGFGVGSL
jgi:hypothetical protein